MEVPQLDTWWQVFVGPGSDSRGPELHHLDQGVLDLHCWVQRARAACPAGNDAPGFAIERKAICLCWPDSFGAGWRSGGAEADDTGEGAGDGRWSPVAAGSRAPNLPFGARVCLSDSVGFG